MSQGSSPYHTQGLTLVHPPSSHSLIDPVHRHLRKKGKAVRRTQQNCTNEIANFLVAKWSHRGNQETRLQADLILHLFLPDPFTMGMWRWFSVAVVGTWLRGHCIVGDSESSDHEIKRAILLTVFSRYMTTLHIRYRGAHIYLSWGLKCTLGTGITVGTTKIARADHGTHHLVLVRILKSS